MQLLTNAGWFASSLFVPLWARTGMGASDFTVGVIVSLFAGAMFFSQYLFGRAADVYGKRLFLLFGLVISAVAVPLQALCADPLQLALARLMVGFAGGIYPPALLAYVYLSRQEMGKSVSFGSLGWGVGTFVAGAFAAYWQVFLASGLMFAASFALALTLPPIREQRLSVPFFPKSIIRRNLPVYSALLIRHTGASAIWATLPIYLSLLGASNFQIGLLYAANALTQFVVMYNLDRLGSVRSFYAGLVLSSATFVAYALASSIWLMVIPQIMIALSWSFMYVGALKFVAERNAEVATSTGLVGSTIALSGIIGPLLGGAVSHAFGSYTAMMYLAAGMTVGSMAIFSLQLRAGLARPLPEAGRLAPPVIPMATSGNLQMPSAEILGAAEPEGAVAGRGQDGGGP
jgi:MFS family permease